MSLKAHFVTTFFGYVVAGDIFTLHNGYSLNQA